MASYTDEYEDGHNPNREFVCLNCYHEALEVEFWPGNGNPARYVCPNCLSTDVTPIN
jgi:hypothetical protein